MANKIFTFIAAFLLSTQVALAASATARVSANVLEPVKVALAQATSLQQARAALEVNSARDVYFNLSLNARDVCPSLQAEALAQATCQTVTVNFN